MTSSSSTNAPTSVAGFPEDPPRVEAKQGVYYGWWILVITFTATFFATGIHDTVFSVMLKPISEDLGWSRTQISVPISLSIWVGAMLAPFAGRLMDARGPRLMTTLGCILIGFTYFMLSIMGAFWFFFMVYPIGRAASQTTMLGSIPSTAISNWFVRKRGRALGFQAMANGVAGASLALIAQVIIDNWGWRTVFVVFGIFMSLVAIPAVLFLRRRPEDMGLLPDGDTPEEAAKHSHEVTSRAHRGHGHGARFIRTGGDYSVRDALRTKTLWLLVSISALSSTGTGAIHLHLAPYLTDSAISASAAAGLVGLSALIGGFASLFWGVLSERVAPNRGILLIYVTTAISVVILASFTSILAAFAFAVIYGFASRGGYILLSVATADYYGRSNLGTIQGLVVPMQTAGLGVGQIMAPLIRDWTGSYQLAFYILAGMYMTAALIGTRVRPPQRATPATAEAAS